MKIPGIKALLSTWVAEGLLVATGLAGVGARALRFLLDSDWRAVKCHRYNKTVNRKTEIRVGTHKHTELCIFSSLIQPCPDTTVVNLKGKCKYFCLHRNLFYVPAKMLK